MRKFFFLISFLSLFLLPSLAQANDELLVRYLKGTTTEEKEAARGDGEVLNKYTIVPRLELLKVDDPKAALKELNSDPNVQYAVLDIKRELLVTPNDGLFGAQWGMRNNGQTILGDVGVVGADIKATSAWGIQTGSSNTDVAVIDSGIQLNHPDLVNNLWTNPDEIASNGIDDDANGYIDDIHGWNFIDNNNNPTDTDGHGTHVAGIIGAQGNNSIGVAGVNWDVSMAALKACVNDACPLSATIEALEYAVNEGIMISNNSYGGCCGEYLPEKTALENARTAGHLFVAAAGNDNVNNDNPALASYPASYDLSNVISVASSTNQEDRSSFSNYGATTVDLFAPGENIASTYIGSDYVYLSGTSMASPQVAGAAAIIKSQKSGWGYQQIKDQILNSARVNANYNNLVVTDGILDLNQALLIQPENLTGPDTETFETSATFDWDTINNATFKCSLDSGSFETCSPEKTYTDLSLGTHSFSVKAIYPSGESETVGYNWEVTVLTVDPPTINSSPEPINNSKSATFSFAGLPGAGFMCSLDDAPFTACTSPTIYTNLDAEAHSFKVKQTFDSITSDPATVNWQIPEVVDMVPLADGPNVAGFLTFPSLPSGYTYLCQITGYTSQSECQSPYAPSAPLTNGPYQLELTIEDPLGYLSQETAYLFEISGVPAPISNTPSLVINSGAQYTNRSAVTLNIVWPAGARTMSISNGDGLETVMPVTGSVPWELTPGSGAKTITIKFNETVGGTIKTSSKTIIVDTVAPVINRATVKRSASRYSFRLSLAKSDKLQKVYLSRSRTIPSTTNLGNTSRSISSTNFTFNLSFYPNFIRVRDAAGNLSAWKKTTRF
jgi:subtilisin family serine protease